MWVLTQFGRPFQQDLHCRCTISSVTTCS